MSFVSSGISAIAKLAALALLAGAFLLGMAGVVYMSLQGSEIQVPEITGKELSQSEKELASLGLKIKKRADRASSEPPGTVIEQLPKPGETVKTGQMILVVTSKGQAEGDVPPSLKNTSEEDDAEKIEEMISDKPKKPKANSNSRKKADTARDVTGNTSTTNSNSNSSDPGSNKSDSGSNNNSADKPKPNTPAPGKTPNPSSKTPDTKPKPPARP